MRMPSPSGFVTGLALLAVAAPAAGQGFLASQVDGAQHRASYFAARYDAAPGQTWVVDDHLIHVYRATIDEGTLVVGATLAAGTAPRTALGPSSQQTLRIRGTAGSVWKDTHSGTPSEALSVEVEVPWTKAATIFSYPLFLAYDVEVANLYATCGTTYGCLVRHTIVVLPHRGAVAIDGIERDVPALLLRQAEQINLASAGISPFAEWESIAIDGATLTKIPFIANYQTPPAGQWYRHPVRAGDPTQSGDPLPPSGLVHPSVDASIEDFLSCGGGGCGTHQARIGLGQEALAPGLHTVTLRTRPFAGATYAFYQTSASVGGGLADDQSQHSVDFILFGPRMEATPAEAGPGQMLTVRGSGFAPNSSVRIAAIISCCGRRAELGTFDTDVTGSFEAQPTLPPAGDAFFTDVIQSGPRVGSIQVDVDDPQFLADYFGGIPQYEHAAVTFVPVATETTTTTTAIGSTTTLPGGGPGDVGLDDTPACAATPVPARAVEKFDSADQSLDFVEQMIIEGAKRKAIRKVIGKADAALGATRRLVNRARKKGLIPEGCAVAAFDLIDELRERAREAKQNLKR